DPAARILSRHDELGEGADDEAEDDPPEDAHDSLLSTIAARHGSAAVAPTIYPSRPFLLGFPPHAHRTSRFHGPRPARSPRRPSGGRPEFSTPAEDRPRARRRR